MLVVMGSMVVRAWLWRRSGGGDGRGGGPGGGDVGVADAQLTSLLSTRCVVAACPSLTLKRQVLVLALLPSFFCPPCSPCLPSLWYG